MISPEGKAIFGGALKLWQFRRRRCQQTYFSSANFNKFEIGAIKHFKGGHKIAVA